VRGVDQQKRKVSLQHVVNRFWSPPSRRESRRTRQANRIVPAIPPYWCRRCVSPDAPARPALRRSHTDRHGRLVPAQRIVKTPVP
jgi:hypothetical protein